MAYLRILGETRAWLTAVREAMEKALRAAANMVEEVRERRGEEERKRRRRRRIFFQERLKGYQPNKKGAASHNNGQTVLLIHRLANPDVPRSSLLSTFSFLSTTSGTLGVRSHLSINCCSVLAVWLCKSISMSAA